MRRPRRKLEVNTFPFLAVLICAMGSLILLLMIMDRRAKIVAQNRARDQHLAQKLAADAERAEKIVARESARKELEAKVLAEWAAKKEKLHADLTAEGDELAREITRLLASLAEADKAIVNRKEAVTAQQQRLALEDASLKSLQKEIADRRDQLARVQDAKQSQLKRREELTRDVLLLEAALKTVEARKVGERPVYSLVPYKGKHGASAKPVYVEIADGAIAVHPGPTKLSGESLSSESFRKAIEQRTGPLEKDEFRPGMPPQDRKNDPYVLFLVRPNGISIYYQVLQSLRGYHVDFGYELVEADWVFDFGDGSLDRQPWRATARIDVEPSNVTRPPPKGMGPRMLPNLGSAQELPPAPGTGGGPGGAGGPVGGAVGGTTINGPIGVPGGAFVARPPGDGFPGGSGGLPGTISTAPIVTPGIPVQRPGSSPYPGPTPSGSFNGNGPTLADRSLPGTGYPAIGVPGGGYPGTNPPGAAGPGSAIPGLGMPGSTPPFSGIPGVAGPSTGNPGTNAPGSGVPTSGIPGTGVPTSNSPLTGNPGTGIPGAAGSGSSNPGTNAPGSGTPGTGSPGSNPPIAGNPGTGNPGSGAPGTVAANSGTNPMAAANTPTPGNPLQPPLVEKTPPAKDATSPTEPSLTFRNIPPTVSPNPGVPSGSTGSAGGSSGGDGEPGPSVGHSPFLPAEKEKGRSSPRLPALGRITANRDFILTVECYEAAVSLSPPGRTFDISPDAIEQLARQVKTLVDRRQATVRPGEPPYRPIIAFRVHPDGRRTYYAVYPRLAELGYPMNRETPE